jgi:hypothetical protein
MPPVPAQRNRNRNQRPGQHPGNRTHPGNTGGTAAPNTRPRGNQQHQGNQRPQGGGNARPANSGVHYWPGSKTPHTVGYAHADPAARKAHAKAHPKAEKRYLASHPHAGHGVDPSSGHHHRADGTTGAGGGTGNKNKSAEDKLFGANKSIVNAAAYEKYHADEQTLANQAASTQQHNKDLDQVFDSFKQTLLGQAQATAGAQQANAAQQQAAGGQALSAAGQAMGTAIGSSAAVDTGVGTKYAADLAQQAQQAQNSTLARNQIQQAATTDVGQANLNSISQLGLASDTERARQHGATLSHLYDVQKTARDLQGEKQAYKLTYNKELQDTATANRNTQIQNEIAKYAITTKDKASRRQLAAAIARITGAKAIARGHDTTATAIATQNNQVRQIIASGKNETSIANSLRQAGVSAANAKAAAHATIQAAKIRAAASGGGGAGGKKGVTLHTSDGKTFQMTSSEREKWNSRFHNLIGAVRAMRKQLVAGQDEGKTVKDIASQFGIPRSVAQSIVGSANGFRANDIQALKAFFPHGIVPPGYLVAGFK